MAARRSSLLEWGRGDEGRDDIIRGGPTLMLMVAVAATRSVTMVMHDAVFAVAGQVDGDAGDGVTDLAIAWAGLHPGRTASLAIERRGTAARGPADRPFAWVVPDCRVPEEGDGIDALRAAVSGPMLANEAVERLHAGQTESLDNDGGHGEVELGDARRPSRQRETDLSDSASRGDSLQVDGKAASVRADDAHSNVVRRGGETGTELGERRPRTASRMAVRPAARRGCVPYRRGADKERGRATAGARSGSRRRQGRQPPPPFPPPTTAPLKGRLEGVAQLHDEIGARVTSPLPTLHNNEARKTTTNIRTHGGGSTAQGRGPPPPFPPPTTAPREGRLEGVVQQQGGARALLERPPTAAPVDDHSTACCSTDVPSRNVDSSREAHGVRERYHRPPTPPPTTAPREGRLEGVVRLRGEAAGLPFARPLTAATTPVYIIMRPMPAAHNSNQQQDEAHRTAGAPVSAWLGMPLTAKWPCSAPAARSSLPGRS